MVFISYSTADANEAYIIKSVLDKNGVKAWMAPESIPAGSNYTKEIPKAISECSVFLLVLSDNAQKSVWVSAEVERAFKCSKIIMPFVIEDCALQDDFDFLLSRSQRITAYEKKADALENLVIRIKSLIQVSNGTVETKTETKTEPPVNVKTETVPPVFTEKTTIKTETVPPVFNVKTTVKTETDSNGDLYTGEVTQDGKRTGTGTLRKANGNVYTGGFLNGLYHGKGKFMWTSGDFYEGDYANGKRTGNGKYVWSNGDVYEGGFMDNFRNGKGKLTWKNGDVYEGDFVSGKRTGKGRFTWKNGDVYEGDFFEDKRIGKGKYVWTSGNIYEGDFADGKRTGKGKLTWKCGDVYEGDFVDGKRTGYGIIRWANGAVYEGNCVNDVHEGRGKYTEKNGEYFIGEFKKNNYYLGAKYKPDGSIICFYEKGKKKY